MYSINGLLPHFDEALEQKEADFLFIKNIYIAENPDDLFETQIPEYNTETEELPPEVEEVPQSDSFFTAYKIPVILVVCIVVVLLSVLIFKNKKQDKDASAREIFSEDEIETNNSETPEYTYPKINKSKNLNTLSSIHKCITSFLEKTKDI